MPSQDTPLLTEEEFVNALATWAVSFSKKLEEREQSQKEAS